MTNERQLKRQLRDFLVVRRLDEVGQLAGRYRRVLGALTALTFDADPLIGWRAVEALGVAAAKIGEYDLAAVREHMRRLQWLLSEESGGICWRAPEAMAEIVHACPTWFVEWVPIIVHLLLETAEEDLPHFRVGILWAIGRIGSLCTGSQTDVLPAITAALDDPDSQVRGMAAWCLVQLGQSGILTARPSLLVDHGPVELFEDGRLRRTSVAEVSAAADDGSLGGT